MISLKKLFLWGLSQMTIYRRPSRLCHLVVVWKKGRKRRPSFIFGSRLAWLHGGNPRLLLRRPKRPFLWHPPCGTRSPIYSAHSRGRSWGALEGRERNESMGGETGGYRHMHWHENRFKVSVTRPKQEAHTSNAVLAARKKAGQGEGGLQGLRNCWLDVLSAAASGVEGGRPGRQLPE